MIKNRMADILSGNHPANIAKGNIMISIRLKWSDVLNNKDFLEFENIKSPKLKVIPMSDQIMTEINIICNSLKCWK